MENQNQAVVKTVALTKKFAKNVAAGNVNLSVNKGDIYGLIGRNGAGKTTVLKMISGLLKETSGSIELFGAKGNEIIKQHKLRKVGTLIEAPGLQKSMTAYDNLKLKCICMGLDTSDEYIYSLLELVGLKDVGKKKVGAFSLGMKQRLGIAIALVGEPEVLILDEPINGLDPQGIAEVRELLTKLNKEYGITIIVSSHILEELSKIVNRYGIIEKGRMIREFTHDELEAECADRVIIKTLDAALAEKVLSNSPYRDFRINLNVVEIIGHTEETPEIVKLLATNDVPIRTVEIGGKTLEEFFFELVGGEKNV